MGRQDGATSARFISRVTNVNIINQQFTVATPPLYGSTGNFTGNFSVKVYRPANERPFARIINSYGTHQFRNVNFAYDHCIHVETNTSQYTQFFPTIIFENSMFANGRHLPNHPTAIFTTTSSGPVQLVFRSNREATAWHESIHGGKWYPDATLTGTLANGVFTPA